MNSPAVRLIILSGRSGSGKSTALNALEDAGFNCIDNFPLELLESLMDSVLKRKNPANQAVCVDARNTDLERFPEILVALDRRGIESQVIYLDALSPTLVKRFSETRRRHPLTSERIDLQEAIDAEQSILEGIADLADLTIDTTSLSNQQLIETIRSRVIENKTVGLSLMFRSFGFKYGVPVDADYVFDVRCLPNPHWVEGLRALTGLDGPVEKYLEGQELVNRMFGDVQQFVERWLSCFEDNHRTYLTVAIGCTGGQHRSVYLAERLGAYFEGLDLSGNVLVRHRELQRQ